MSCFDAMAWVRRTRPATPFQMSKTRSMPITIKVASAQVPDIRENVDAVGRTGLVTAEMAAENREFTSGPVIAHHPGRREHWSRRGTRR